MAIARQVAFLANGYDLADWLTNIEFTAEAESLDATVLSGTMRAYEPGAVSASIETDGLFAYDETNQAAIHDVLTSALANRTTQVITSSLELPAAGGVAQMLNGEIISYGVEASYGELMTVSAEFESNGGAGAGVWLMHELVAAGTTNGTSVDGGAATTNGGLFQAHLHNDTASDVDVKVQHSTTGVGAWVDLAAVSDLSADYAAGTAAVAPGTTVNRYLRAVATVSGGDTILIGAAFARNY